MGKHYALGAARKGLESLMQDVRGCRVLLDYDAAEYFQVEMRTLNAAVNRHQIRFPADFMLVLSRQDSAELERRGTMRGSRKAGRIPARGFTEVGIDMLAGLLKSRRAIAHSVENIREGVAAFNRVRAVRP